MNQDLSKVLVKPSQYFLAENMSLTTESGESSLVLRNIKGNALAINIPDTSNVMSIEVIDFTIGNSITITVNGTDITIVFSTLITYLEALIAAINDIGGIQAVLSPDNKIYVYSLLDTDNALVHATITITSGNAAIDITELVPAQLNNKIIGWVTVREAIVLVTTNEVEVISPTTSYGQLWRLLYNKVNFTYSLVLLYNNQLNLTLQHPIANPGMIVGNYESIDIQNVYWTDEYNVPRKANIADSSLFAIDPDNMEWSPDITFQKPSIVAINPSGGAAKTGIHQFTYRLKNLSGAVINSAIFSQQVFITAKDEAINTFTNKYTEYVGTEPGIETSKSIEISVTGLDPDFERIEFISIYRANYNAIPVITVISDEPIPVSGNASAVYTGLNPITELTLDDITVANVQFSKVGVLASKDNYLFAGRTVNREFDIDFDARAYRFQGVRVTGRKAHLVNSDGNNITLDGNNAIYGDVPEDHDAIQDYESQGPFTYNNYLYQQDGTTVGGTGPKVAYEIIQGDPDIDDSFCVLLDDRGFPTSYAPYIELPNSSKTIDFNDGQTYTHVTGAKNYHSPYISGVLKGFQRDEMYRFGIEFISKKGEVAKVKWIADIRMPHMFMPDPTLPNDNERVLAYPICKRKTGTNEHWGCPLGLRVIVDTSNLEDQISAFRIVVVERTDDDKTILGQGSFHIGLKVGSDHIALIPNGVSLNSDGGGTHFPGVNGRVASINSPEFLFGAAPTFARTDYIDLVTTLMPFASVAITEPDGTLLGFNVESAIKNYTCFPIGSTTPRISQIFTDKTNHYHTNTFLPFPNLPLTDSLDLDSTGIANRGPFQVDDQLFENISCNPNGGIERSTGSKTLALAGQFQDFNRRLFANPFSPMTVDYDGVWDEAALYIANYKRLRGNQYGGNTFSARSNSEYINTSHYQIVDVGIVYDNYMFGGDTYICAFDNIKNFVNPAVAQSDEVFVGRFFPVETTFNIDLRAGSPIAANDFRGEVFNKIEFPTAAEEIATGEVFILEDVYNQPDNLKKSFPDSELDITSDTHDYRVWNSEKKINAETLDSWLNFKPDNHIDLDGQQGKLTNLIVEREQLIGFQPRGIVRLSVNERSLITDGNDAALTLGTGDVLARYDYTSKLIGSSHQFGFTQSPEAVFFYDRNTKSIYKLGGNKLEELSLIKGMSSYLNNNLNGLLALFDNPFLNTGLTATYDYNNSEAFFTFKDTTTDSTTQGTLEQILMSGDDFLGVSVNVPGPMTIDPNKRYFIQYTTTTGELVIEEPKQTSGIFLTTPFVVNLLIFLDSELRVRDIQYQGNITVFEVTEAPFTLVYNDFTDGFTAFYGHKPSVYINDITNIFSPSSDLQDMWIHGKGLYANFYGVQHDVKIKFLVNAEPTETKVFDNFEMLTEVISPAGINITETFDEIRMYNDYQNTDWQILSDFSKRKERTWNIAGLRNQVLYTTVDSDIFTDISPTSKLFGERLRDKYLWVEMLYSNGDNKLILDCFNTQARKSSR